MLTDNPRLEVLLVEDNPADIYLIKKAIHAEDPACHTVAIGDGDTAIEYLAGERPDIVVLDLNIPRRDGLEVLHFIRAEERLAGLFVAIFSSSPKDAMERIAPLANAHIQKPFELDSFLRVGEIVMRYYWQSQKLK